MSLKAILVILFSFVSVSKAAGVYGIIGDAGRETKSSKLVRDSMERLKVFQTILPGDNLYAGTYAAVWAPWQKARFSFDVVAIGNHNSGYENEMRFFNMPAEHFAKVIDGARFVVLNSDNNLNGKAQSEWLDQQLNAAGEKLIFLVYHHPSYTISKAHSWDEKKNFQLAIRPIIWKHRSKITALILGHDHLASLLHFNDLPVILSGAVQEVRKDKGVDYALEGIHVKTSWFFDSRPAWARLTADAVNGVARVDFVRAQDDKVSCTATIETGRPAQLQSNCY